MEKTEQKELQDMQKSTKEFYSSLFYIGWRPTLFWAITLAAIYSFLIRPIISTVVFIIDGTNMPPLDNPTILSLVAMVLGGSAIRGIEKYTQKYITGE